MGGVGGGGGGEVGVGEGDLTSSSYLHIPFIGLLYARTFQIFCNAIDFIFV